MGTGSASALTLALHDSDSWAFSVELSLAAVFSFGPGDLCRGGFAATGGNTDPGDRGAGSHGLDGHCDVNPAYDWLPRFSAHMDLSWARGVLVSLGDRAALF